MIQKKSVINEKRILIEGWRGINHSYALVNQYQLIWLSKLTSHLYHHDVQYINGAWDKEVNSNGFDPKMNSIIANISACNGQSRPPDITYRIASPLKSCEFNSELKYVFGTSELQTLEGKGSDEDIKILIQNENETIVTPSSWSAIGFSNAGISEERIKVIPHGIEPSIFYPEENGLVNQCRKKLGIGESDFVILSLGAMTENKGIDILLLAYAILKKKYHHIRLILKDQSNLYGSGPTNELRSFITKNPKVFSQFVRSGIILISDNLSTDMLRTLYSSVQCYASPYRAEGFNMTPLEAAACGVPIIITDGGSTEEYAHKSFAIKISSTAKSINNQHYLEPDLDCLIEKLSNLIEGKSNQLSKKIALSRIKELHSWEHVTKMLYNIL